MDVQQQRAEDHPLYKPLMAAIHQAMFGKGVRHGGATVPWLEQPIFHYANMHGRGFLTGQAAKKLEEAANTRHGEAFITEVLGAIVYCGAALIREQQLAAERGEDRISFDRKWPWLKSPEEPLAKIDLSRVGRPEPLCEGSISAEKERVTRMERGTLMQEQQLQGHDGPGGVILQANPTRAGTSPWSDYAYERNSQELVGRYGAGRFDKVPAPAPAVDAEVWANRELRNCDTCRHKYTHIEAQPCCECHPRHGWPFWEAPRG